MPTVRSPAGTRLFMQSAISATQQITALSKANPAVVTYAGADTWVNANYAALSSMSGMTEFEDALVKVANVNTAANTFEAQSQDSTLYGTFVAGNAQLVTLATEITTGTGISFEGGEPNFAEYFLMNDTMSRKFPTTVGGITMKMKCIWDPNDAGLTALRIAAETKSKRGFKLLFADGLEMLFFGYVGASGLPRADNMQSVIEADVSVVCATRPRYV